MLNQKKPANNVSTAPTLPEIEKVSLYEIQIGPKIKVTRDSKSGARVINFPFEFPSAPEEDGARGVIIVCRLQDEEWVPSQNIKSITINFYED